MLLGSNLDPDRWAREGPSLVEGAKVLASSRVWKTAAEGPPGQPRFANRGLLVETDLDEEGLRAALRRAEAAAGRLRTGDPYAPRTLDLDIVWYAGRWLPDPAVARPYGILPLSEVAGDLEAPGGGTLKELAARLRRHPSILGAE